MREQDPALLNKLRAADPARRLLPQSSTSLNQRMEQIMTEQPPTPAATVPARRPAFRKWMPAIGLLAGLAIAAAIIVPLFVGGAKPSIETLRPPASGGLASVSCMVLGSATVAAQEQAFAATVTELRGKTVVLEVTERFAGAVADRVEVRQVDAMDFDFSGVPFEVGQSYLVGAFDGTISGCGVTGADSAELRAVYDAAFNR